jgi:uncharacterized protein YjcR
MPRKRDPRRDEAFKMWKECKGEITNREIARQLEVPEKTIGGWKSKDNWNGVLQTDKRSTPKQKGKKQARAPSKRSGNHNPKNQFAKRNKAAEKFGFLSKYLPEEYKEIMETIAGRKPEDLLWDQIVIQYTAIIRSQKIMLVNNADDLSKEQSQSGWGDSGADKYEVRFAYEKQAAFLNAQSRAISELRTSIRQFLQITDEFDERHHKLELVQARIDQIRATTDTGAKTEDKLGNLLDKLEEAFTNEPE